MSFTQGVLPICSCYLDDELHRFCQCQKILLFLLYDYVEGTSNFFPSFEMAIIALGVVCIYQIINILLM